MNNQLEQLKTFVKNGVSVEQIVTQMLNNNPALNNIITMVKSGDSKSVETFARNMFKEQGRDFDKEFTDFMNNFK